MPRTPAQLLQASDQRHPKSEGLCLNYLWSAGTCEKGNKLSSIFRLVLQFFVCSRKKAEAGRVEITASYSWRRKSPNENFHISLILNYFDSFPSRRHRLNAHAGTALSDVDRWKSPCARSERGLVFAGTCPSPSRPEDVNLKFSVDVN